MTTLAEAPTDRLVEHLQARFGLTTLVETGTHEGVSTLWAAQRFARVVTIDIRDDDHETAKERCRDHRNVEFLKGDTREMLSGVVASLDGPALFWLDAHAAVGMFGDHDDWPPLEELEIINRSLFRHYVFIDDAHCFLPGSPHPACPAYAVVHALAISSGYACRIIGDVIVLVPFTDLDALDNFGRDA